MTTDVQTNEIAPGGLGDLIAPPYDWLAIDIETANATPTELERWFRLAWSPSPRWGCETIGKRFHDLHTKKLERLALLDESPIICVSLRSESELRCLHILEDHPPKQMRGGLVEGLGDAAQMLGALRTLFAARVTPDTTIVGHNIVAFDLPKLRWAFVRTGVALPDALSSRDQPVYDTMREYCRRFSINKDVMIALADVVEDFGLQAHKDIVSGAEMPELFERKEFELILTYALADVLLEAELFRRMTGIAPGLK